MLEHGVSHYNYVRTRVMVGLSCLLVSIMSSVNFPVYFFRVRCWFSVFDNSIILCSIHNILITFIDVEIGESITDLNIRVQYFFYRSCAVN